MSLILILSISLALSSTLAWIGFYAGVRALPGGRARLSRWIIGSAMVAAASLVGVFLVGAAGAFRSDAFPPRIPMAVAAPGLSPVADIPPHRRRLAALAHRQTDLPYPAKRVAGPLFSRASCPVFALRAGIGFVATGLLAPFVAFACIAVSFMRAAPRSGGIRHGRSLDPLRSPSPRTLPLIRSLWLQGVTAVGPPPILPGNAPVPARTPITATVAQRLESSATGGFAAEVYVAATMTNGFTRQSQYDAEALMGFVLPPQRVEWR